jgi:hypothetical protein
VQDEAAEDPLGDRVQAQLERGDHAEAPAAAAQRPQQLRVLVLRRAHQPAIGGDELRRDEVVAGEAVLALQPAGAAAEREPADAGGGHAAARGGEAVRLGGAVDLRPGGAAADAGDAGGRVHLDVAHRPHVEHEPVVDEREAGHGVPAGAHRHRQALLAGEGERGDDVVGGRAAGDQAGPALDHRVEQGAGVLVGGGPGLVQVAPQPEAELLDGGGRVD